MSKISDILSEVNAKHPGGVMLASELKNIKQEDIPTGIYELDYRLGGGWSRGCAYHVYGESGHGKSATMTQTIAHNHKVDPNFVAAILNLEGNWGPKYVDFMERMGVDMDRCMIITNVETEATLDIGLTLAKSRQLDFLVIDSAAAMMSSKEVDKKMEDGARTADRASMIERYIRKLIAHLHPKRVGKVTEPNPCAVVFLNQLRTGGIGGYRAFRQPASSDALKFFVRNQISCYSSPKDDAINYAYVKEIESLIEPNDQTEHYRNKGKIGKKIRYEIEKSRSGDESAEAAVDFYFKDLMYPSASGFMDIGFDTLGSLINVAVTMNLIENAGSWYSCLGNKYQGSEKLTQALRLEHEFRDSLITIIEERMYGRRISAYYTPEDSEEEEPEVREESGKKAGNGTNKGVRGSKKA